MANSQVRKEIFDFGKKLTEYSQSGRKEKKKMLKILQQLEKYPMSLALLKETEIGISVNKLRKQFRSEKLGIAARSLVKQWRKLVPDIKRPSKKALVRNSDTPQEGCSTSIPEDEIVEPIRQKSRKLLGESLVCEGFEVDFERLAVTIECCVYDEFQCLDSRYKGRIRSRIVNLRDKTNPKLRENVLNGVIAPERFARMTCDEMASDEVKKMKEEMLKRSILEAQVPKTNLSSSNLFKCSRCGERDTTYNQVQTLSGDEPMTTFVVCNKCGKRWKFN